VIEVDLVDDDGVIVSLAAVDETFWAAWSAQALALAADRGLDAVAQTYAPDPGAAERNITCLAEFQAWVAAT
jgi:hypothetical protein